MNYSAGPQPFMGSSYDRASMNRARKARASIRPPGMKRGAAISAGLHVLVLGALLITLPHSPPPPPPDEDTVAVEFEGNSAHAQKSDRTGHHAAPTEAEQPATDNPAPKAPEKAPLEAAPPPPPPPPPPPVQEEVVKAPDVKVVEPPKLTPVPAPAKPPPPPPKSIAKPPPKPVPPPPVKTLRSQPNAVKTPLDTSALDNTLEKYMVEQKQKSPPTHRYNPERGGAKDAGGSKSGFLTGELSNGQRKAIGDEVRRCYSEDTAAKDYASYSVMLVVTIDASGEARMAEVSDSDKGREASDPAFRAFAERAAQAVLDPTCSKLPVPANLLGKPAQQLQFRFRP